MQTARDKTRHYNVPYKKRRFQRISYRDMSIILSATVVALIIFWAVVVVCVINHANPL